ncbi:MAG: LysR family transcriptional regulator, partial [Comamonas sp.]
MDWDHLRYFGALVQAGTLVGAAKALGVEHTTVSRRIQALEK